MSPNQRIAQLRKLGKSQAQLARDLNKSSTLVSLVIRGHSRSTLVETHIAGLLGKERFEVFPDTTRPFRNG